MLFAMLKMPPHGAYVHFEEYRVSYEALNRWKYASEGSDLTLKKKIGLIIFASLFAMLAVVWVITQRFLLGGFENLEEEITAANVRRCIRAISRSVEDLEILASNWALWDDTYSRHAMPVSAAALGSRLIWRILSHSRRRCSWILSC